MDFKKQMDIISVYNCRITALYGEWAKQHGISYHALIVLFALKQHTACTQKQIGTEWMLPKQTVHTVIRELREKGYVQLSAGRNQKEKLVSFTEEGKIFACQILEDTIKMEERVLSRIGEDGCQVMVDSIQQFTEIFEEEIKNYA